MEALHRLLNSLSAAPTVRGAGFERVCKWFLENDPRYSAELETVWLWRDWPDAWGADAGIDLVARTKEGLLWAIQAKAYDAQRTVTKRDLDTFLAESSRPQFDYRLLIATTDQMSENARRTLVGQEKQVGHLLLTDLLNSPLDWPTSIADLNPRRRPAKTPYPYQKTAIKEVAECLEFAPRARLVMACGTGKTLTALYIAETMASRRTLVLVPSLSLLAQTLTEWLANATAPIEYLAVCSDESVADPDAPVAATSDLGLPVTTDPDRIAGFLRPESKAHRVVFATYQSSHRIADAMKQDVPAFNMAVADEAHRCTGPITGQFATILDADVIRAERRLFMTATPRYFTGRIVRETQEADFEIASMDDEAKFGPLAYRLTFGQAIRDKLLTDYRVAIIGVDDLMYREWVKEGHFVTFDGRTTNARSLAGLIGLVKAVREFDLRRIITFHNRVARAQRFADMLPAVIRWMPAHERPQGTLDARHISGAMSTGQRRRLLERLRTPPTHRALISNARCLTEGIDVPSLDGVAFIDPRQSEIDVVQAVGRAIRHAQDKKIGTIVLPVFISSTDDADTALNDSAFKTVWRVLNAMRAHDDELAVWLDELRRGLGRNAGGVVNLPGKVILDLPQRVTPAFVEAVKIRLVEQTTSSWEWWFSQLEDYSTREGHARVPQIEAGRPVSLGTWVSNQRSLREQLTPERQERLEALPGWVWNTLDAQWDLGFTALAAFMQRQGHARPLRTQWESGFNVGEWVAVQRRQRAQLPQGRRERLEALPGWAWNVPEAQWELGFDALEAYATLEGHARPPVSHRKDEFDLGYWVSRQRSNRAAMRQDRRERLEALPGWTWDPFDAKWEQGFVALQAFVAREGHARVPATHQDGEFRLGQWVSSQRTKRETLSAQQRNQLEALPGWMWSAFEGKWEQGFVAIHAFVAREGHARVPATHREGGYKLGQWVAHQRKNREPFGDRSARLEALPGWSWNTLNANWEAAFAALAAYAQREGSANVRLGHQEGDINLGNWVSTQRQQREQMSPERRERLEAVSGWSWSPNDAKWDDAFAALTTYADREGTANVPVKHREGDFKLGRWVSSQRHQHEQMPQDRRQRLEALPGWAWRAQRIRPFTLSD